MTWNELRKDAVSGPTLFDTLLDDVTKEVKNKAEKRQIRFRSMEPIGDDLVFYASRGKELHKIKY